MSSFSDSGAVYASLFILHPTLVKLNIFYGWEYPIERALFVFQTFAYVLFAEIIPLPGYELIIGITSPHNRDRSWGTVQI